MADQFNPWANVPMSEAIPFGAWATPDGSPTALSGMISGLFSMPKHLIDKAAEFDPQDIHGSTVNVAPAAAEMALALAGTGAPAAEAGAAGIFGGKLAKTADVKALIEANDMLKGGKSANQIWGDTGWFKSPTDSKWRFEIPDNNSKMFGHGLNYKEDGDLIGAPASVMFQHPELYKAYPELEKANIYNTVLHNPSNGVGTGSYNKGFPPTIEVNAPNLTSARQVGLHELQHGVQEIEHFAAGGNPNYMAFLQEKAPQKVPLHELKSDPRSMYDRLGG